MPTRVVGRGRETIIIDDYDDEIVIHPESVSLNQAVRNYQPMQRRPGISGPSTSSNRSSSSSDNDEAANEFDLEAEIGNIIDLTADDDDGLPRPQVRHHWTGRLPSLQETYHKRWPPQKTSSNERTYKVNRVYVIEDVQRHLKAEFIQLTQIIVRGTEVIARGLPYARTRTLHGQLPCKLNEVFAIYEVQDDDLRDPGVQALIELPLHSLLKPRALNVTNAEYPAHRFDKGQMSKEVIETDGPLVCRWKYYVHFHTATKREAGTPYEWAIERISAPEAATNRREDPNVVRETWRGPTMKGGSHNPNGDPDSQPSCSNSGSSANKIRALEQRYTVFDSFCGAGGASRGAERAGYDVKYAIDCWDRACDSHRMNFPSTKLYEMDVFDFVNFAENRQIRADVLHLSPPCQVWSPAHTVEGCNDEHNVAALFACRTLIEKVRARIVTLEQTFGILNPRFKVFFGQLVQGFTDHGYSVRWKVVNFSSYGLPQRRRRLVMLAAGPGEKLPSFPAHTHSQTGGDGLKKFLSVREALSKITPSLRFTDEHHKPEFRAAPSDAVRGNPNEILPRCMTTSGGQNWHFEEDRPYTNREFALLQGFPIWHKFGTTYVKKQIGNAFPPSVVQVFFEHIQRHLHKEDGFSGDARPRTTQRGMSVLDITAPSSATTPRGRGESKPWPGSNAQEVLAGMSRDLPMIIDDFDDEQGDDVVVNDFGSKAMDMVDDDTISVASSRTLTGDTPEPDVEDRRRGYAGCLRPPLEVIILD